MTIKLPDLINQVMGGHTDLEGSDDSFLVHALHGGGVVVVRELVERSKSVPCNLGENGFTATDLCNISTHARTQHQVSIEVQGECGILSQKYFLNTCTEYTILY